MAQKVQVLLVDDVDGGEAQESLSFALDGATYEIDLSDKNAEQLRSALAPWIGHARRVSARGRQQRPTASRARATTSRSGGQSEVRVWARENGYEVSDRGRLSSEVVAAYEAAR